MTNIGQSSNTGNVVSSEKKLRCTFEEFVTKHLPDIEKRMLENDPDVYDKRDAKDRAELRELLMAGGYFEDCDFKNEIELLGVVWMIAEQPNDKELMYNAEQMWGMYLDYVRHLNVRSRTQLCQL